LDDYVEILGEGVNFVNFEGRVYLREKERCKIRIAEW